MNDPPNAPPHPRLAVGLVSYRRGATTQRCLDSLTRHSRFVSHVYIVDNGSRDSETRRLLQAWETLPRVTVVRLNGNCGPAGGRNRFLKDVVPAYDAVAMLDNDIVVLPGWDKAALEALRAGADLVQPKLLMHDAMTIERGYTVSNPDPLAANPLFEGAGRSRWDPSVNVRRPCAIVSTGIARTRVLKQIGGFDERFFIGEDYDLSFRAREAGFRLLYEPSCEMIHDHRHDGGYDKVRSDLRKILESDVAMWRTHRKMLDNPKWLSWRIWLLRHGEPSQVDWKPCWRHAWRRCLRKLAMAYFMNARPAKWRRARKAEKAINHVERVLARCANGRER